MLYSDSYWAMGPSSLSMSRRRSMRIDWKCIQIRPKGQDHLYLASGQRDRRRSSYNMLGAVVSAPVSTDVLSSSHSLSAMCCRCYMLQVAGDHDKLFNTKCHLKINILKLHKNLCEASVSGLDQVLYRAARRSVVEPLLSSNKKWGARDRNFIAKSLYPYQV